MKAKTINGLASVIGLITLIGMVSVAAAIFDNVQASSHDIRTFSVSAMIGNLIAVPAALSAWSGVLWKKVKDEAKDPTTSLEWIVIFFCAAFLSVIFVAIDVEIRHPGFSFAFTFAAITMSFVALPSALRAWIREQLSRRYGRLEA